MKNRFEHLRMALMQLQRIYDYRHYLIPLVKIDNKLRWLRKYHSLHQNHCPNIET